MHDFKFKNNELYCEDVKVADIAKKVGTPFYLYSENTIVSHFRKLDSAFSEIPHIICYSLKANSNLAICKILAKEGCGADVVSGGEIYKALKSNIKPDKIVYAGVGKTEEEIAFAIDTKILMFNIESISEAVLINKIARQKKVKVNVALRINPDVNPDTHSYITTGKKENKFGINIKFAKEFFVKINTFKNLNVCGLHLHIGSQITKSAPYVLALKKVAKLIYSLRELKINITRLDIGGGLGIIYDEEKPSTALGFAKAVLPIIKSIGCQIILEPGRFIVGNAGILVTKVIYFKKAQVKNFVIVDAGMNDLIRPSLYDAYHQILEVKKNNTKKILADVVGPICESGDFLGKNRYVSEPKAGDLFAVMSAGAYGFSMASNYNSRPRPTEIMVEGDTWEIIRKRETYTDLIKNEI